MLGQIRADVLGLFTAHLRLSVWFLMLCKVAPAGRVQPGHRDHVSAMGCDLEKKNLKLINNQPHNPRIAEK